MNLLSRRTENCIRISCLKKVLLPEWREILLLIGVCPLVNVNISTTLNFIIWLVLALASVVYCCIMRESDECCVLSGILGAFCRSRVSVT